MKTVNLHAVAQENLLNMSFNLVQCKKRLSKKLLAIMVHYFSSHYDRHQCLKQVELRHGDSDRHLEQSETSESGWDELLQA